jgi:hypothetical protein
MPDTALVIDDLISPRLNSMQQQVLDQIGGVRIDLDPDALIVEAIERTGLNDFGPAGFRPRLNMYAAAIDADAGSTSVNRLILRNRIVRLLCARLLLTDLLNRYPEIHEIQIERPIIVVGLPWVSR